ncbi:hypothetical protein ACFE04_005961 [Oxalis oulophora]
MVQITQELRAKADQYYTGDEICQEKSKFLLSEVGLPTGLLPLHDIEEVGYIEATGFVWLKQKKAIVHKFEKINNKQVSYSTEVTAYVEKNKIKKLTGVKAKELLVWITISDITMDDPPTGKLTFKTPAGLFKTFPTSAFELEDEIKKVNEKKEIKEEVTKELISDVIKA